MDIGERETHERNPEMMIMIKRKRKMNRKRKKGKKRVLGRRRKSKQ